MSSATFTAIFPFSRPAEKGQFSTDDILLVLGDILEKSTGGLDTLRYLMDLRRTHTLFFLQGNCENVTLDFLNGAWPDQAAAQYGNFWGEKCAWVSMAHQAGVDVSDPKAFPAARQALRRCFPKSWPFSGPCPLSCSMNTTFLSTAGSPESTI